MICGASIAGRDGSHRACLLPDQHQGECDPLPRLVLFAPGYPTRPPPRWHELGIVRDVIVALLVLLLCSLSGCDWSGAAMIAGVCRVCACTDSRPCVVDGAGELVAIDDGGDTLPDGCTVCHWIEGDLCSACVADQAPALLFDADGNPLRGAP